MKAAVDQMTELALETEAGQALTVLLTMIPVLEKDRAVGIVEYMRDVTDDARVQLRTAHGETAREMEAAGCSELTEAIALLVAMHVDPLLDQRLVHRLVMRAPHPHPDRPATLTFAVVGDFGTGVRKPSKPERRQREVAMALERAVREAGVRLVLTTGDNIYAGKTLLGIPVGATGDEDDVFSRLCQSCTEIPPSTACTKNCNTHGNLLRHLR